MYSINYTPSILIYTRELNFLDLVANASFIPYHLILPPNTTHNLVLLSGIRQVAVTYGKLPSRDGKLPLRVAAALAWRGALSSSPSLTLF